MQTYRITRVLFGLAPSPFLLGGVLECHLDTWAEKYLEEVERLCQSFYVDDLLTGGQDVKQAQTRKELVREIMSDGTFELHSNYPQLEDNPQPTQGEDNSQPETSENQSYAKQQLLHKPSEPKLLGVKWNKSEYTIAMQFPSASSAPTKCEVLSKLAKVYDPLGLASPTTLQGKQIYCEVCDYKVSWDTTIPENLRSRWQKWGQSLPPEVPTRRALAPYQQPVNSVELHVFGDASTYRIGAAVYSVVRQEDGIIQTLHVVAAKSRLAKRELTIPRLELVSAHMATNLVVKVRNALRELPEPMVYGWLAHTVALHWIVGNGQYQSQ